MAADPPRLDLRRPYLQLHSADVFVRDLDRSLQFYTGCLGFQLAFDARLDSGERWVGVAPPDGSAVLTLRQPKPDSPNYKLIGRAMRAVFVTDDVAGLFKLWMQRGVRFRHTPKLRRVSYQTPGTAPADGAAKPAPVWGQIFTRFEDIDRNSFALVSFDEVSRAIDAQRRATEERAEAERRTAHEIEIARQVQARLFPQTLPEVRTLEYAGVCVQARQVGGDYYDFLNLGQDRLGLVLGDIAGKGIAAALLMANLQANVRTQCAIALDQPEQFLRSVNRLFHQNTTASAYATLFFGEYDDRSQRLRYVNCGHLDGLLLRAGGGMERLESTSTVLGLFGAWDCAAAERQLAPGDTLVLYTDGVTECCRATGEEFGEPGLLSALGRHGALPPAPMVDALMAEVQQFGGAEQQDDITLIVARCTGK